MLFNFDLSKLPTCIGWSGDYKGDLPLVAPLNFVQWLSAPFGDSLVSYSILNVSSNAHMIEKNPESATGMSVETLEQKIAKQEERLKQLKAQKQAVIAREKKETI